MSLSEIFARIVALIGATAILFRRLKDGANKPAFGSNPTIPAAKRQGIPTLKMPTARGWRQGATPVAAIGLNVNAFATGLKHPRWIHVLPNGNVLAAEALSVAAPIKTAFDYAMFSTMKRAAAVGVSPNRITLLRNSDGDGVAETREVFLEELNQPFGMALLGDTFYVGNADGVVAFPYTAGASRITEPGRKLAEFKPGGHWTRSLLPTPDGLKVFVGVGSFSNIGESGMALEEGRAAIYEIDLASGRSRIFASGLRNPVGLAWEPQTGALWTVVNERDGLGDELLPTISPRCVKGPSTGGPIATGGRRLTAGCPRIRPRSQGRRHRITRWAGTPRRLASVGCPPARFPVFRRVWSSGSTAPGIAAR